MSKAWMNLEGWHHGRVLDAQVGVDQTTPEQRAEEDGLYRRDSRDECLEPPYDWEREAA